MLESAGFDVQKFQTPIQKLLLKYLPNRYPYYLPSFHCFRENHRRGHHNGGC